MSEWTLESLREHLESKIDAVEGIARALVQEELGLRLARRQDDMRAMDKAEEAMSRRLDSMNEFRDQLNAQAATFVRQDSYETALNEWQTWRRMVDDRSKDFITHDKFDDKMKAELDARALALERVNEKFEEYVKRYEARQREVDLLLTAQTAAAEAAKQAAADEGRRSRYATEEQGRRQSRNLVVVGLVLTFIVALANFVGPHIQ